MGIARLRAKRERCVAAAQIADTQQRRREPGQQRDPLDRPDPAPAARTQPSQREEQQVPAEPADDAGDPGLPLCDGVHLASR